MNEGFLSGGEELGQLIRSIDWTNSPLGPVVNWPQSLRSALSICLNSNFPIAIYWGADLHLLYNDAWSPIPGNKHPWALGRAAREVWPEIWSDIEPQFAKAFSGQPGGSKDALLPMQRHGYTEECYFDFTFTPIYGEGGTVDGVFNAVIETTYRVVNERRSSFLKQIAFQLAGLSTAEEAYQQAVSLLAGIAKDVPFAFLYTVDGPDEPRLFATTETQSLPSKSLRKPLPFTESSHTRQPLLIDDLDDYLMDVPNGFWPERPTAGVLVPLRTNQGMIHGYLFCGLSARLAYDEEYKLFIESIANAIVTVLQTIASLEEERKRSEALAEIDRAKTTFFTNISHEFRTPLTLLLSPLEEMRNAPQTDPTQKAYLDVAHRNALRMQKLVNTLLEFSKIEAGRLEAIYRPVDIAQLTAELASTFRSAIEKAGMQLVIECQPITGDVFLDPDMWEKIILNLISNAFKYSQNGTITVGVKQLGDQVEVSVADTGIGIAADQLDKLFDRFHRIENSPGRSQEGTGIGLALVKELVKLLHGTIGVTSQPGQGTVFSIRLPIGNQHIPPDNVYQQAPLANSRQARAYVQEAMTWIPDGRPAPSDTILSARLPEILPADKTYTVLVVDDNADMRGYVERLLSTFFDVITAPDGEDAFAKILRHRPHLILSDVMMPKLDGFGLLQKVRNHPDLKAIPFIFLSARAGQEATVEGLDAGADDYLVKPFSARELIVRITNQIRINQVRSETEQQFYQLFLQAPALINVFKGPNHTYEFFHPKNKELFGDVDFTGMTLRDALPELENQGILDMLDEVYSTGITIHQSERAVEFINQEGRPEEHYMNFIYQPWYDVKGRIQGVLNFAIDVTQQVKAQKLIEKSEQNLRNIFTQAPVAMAIFKGPEQIVETANERMLAFWGKTNEDVLHKSVFDGLPEIRNQGFEDLLSHVYTTGEPYSALERSVVLQRRGQLEVAYVNFAYEALRESDGTISGIMTVAVEVTEQVLARKKIEEAEEKARLAIDSADLGTYEVNLLTDEITTSDRFRTIWGVSGAMSRKKIADRIHPEDRIIRENAHLESLQTGQLRYEARTVGDDGMERWAKISGKVIFDSEGRAISLLGVIQDITSQKQFSQQLSVQVRERTQELQRSNGDLQQFAHVASHDLKEPVRKIKLFSSRLQQDYGHELPEKGQLFLTKIQNATDRMFSMIEGVLTYSSLNALPQLTETIDLNATLEAIERDLEVLMEQKGARIDSEPLPLLVGVPVLIYQLFYNLINNSLKFSKSDEPPVISIRSVQETETGNMVKIIVSDNGIGFDQKYAATVFETFTRLHTKDAYEGTGLGLALCKKIVERHHGTITAEGTPNQGATFILTLPGDLPT